MKTVLRFALVALLLMGTASAHAQGQSALPAGMSFAYSLKGTCSGIITEQRNDRTDVVRDRPFKCDSVAIMQLKDHTVLAFSNGDPDKITFSIAGVRPVTPRGGADYFTSDLVGWESENMVPSGGDGGCVFYFRGQPAFSPGWETHMSGIKCNVAYTYLGGTKHMWVIFGGDVSYTIGGQQFTVNFTPSGRQGVTYNPSIRWNTEFRARSEGMDFWGMCGVGGYREITIDPGAWDARPDGPMLTIVRGGLIDQVFKEVCK
jgi:hypothetical protein